MRKFIVGPPGTGKTTRLVELYYDLIKHYRMETIITISHTNVAADEIRDRIRDQENAIKYGVWDKIKSHNKKFYEDHISTIHSYCKSNLFGAQVFDEECYLELDRQNKLFSRYYRGGKDLKTLSKRHPFWKFLGFATDNNLSFPEYWKRLSAYDRNEYKYNLPQLIRLNDYYQKFKKDYKLNNKSSNVVDFIDMIHQFNKAPKDPNIKVLIVDEAQDSSFPQRKALDKMEKNAEIVYWAGDPDQSIYGFAGANPDYFSRISATPDEELKEGYRCPRIINEYCKEVIAPIWKHYGYTRTWEPREELDIHGKRTGVVIEGEKYQLENLERCPKLPLLIDRLHNTDETFMFTYRANQRNRQHITCLDRILDFFKKSRN
jgi:superfamily I DNA/RNA helicase